MWDFLAKKSWSDQNINGQFRIKNRSCFSPSSWNGWFSSCTRFWWAHLLLNPPRRRPVKTSGRTGNQNLIFRYPTQKQPKNVLKGNFQNSAEPALVLSTLKIHPMQQKLKKSPVQLARVEPISPWYCGSGFWVPIPPLVETTYYLFLLDRVD